MTSLVQNGSGQSLASKLIGGARSRTNPAVTTVKKPAVTPSTTEQTGPSADETAFTNPLHPYVVPVIPAVKNYAWGITGSGSAVAALYARSSGAALSPDTPYAELWIGTHDSTPCSVLSPEDPDATLRTFIEDQVIMVDPDKVAHYTNLHASGLPFLLKVLSVAKPLSIQAHPDIKLAQRLHANSPENYKDANHKPELTVALTPFEAMCGFRPLEDIMEDITRVPEFAEAADRVVADSFVGAVKTGAATPAALRELFSSLMAADQSDIAAAVTALTTRLNNMEDDAVTERDLLFLRLQSYFPGDIGCFGAYLFAHVKLEPGQSIFINANEPHAYISGQCVEIMATSDNVVRAGLTPKHKDVDTLVEMLTYSTAPTEVSEGIVVDDYAVMYAPPVEEFMLVKYRLPHGVTYELQQTTAPTVIVVLSGDGYISVREESAKPAGAPTTTDVEETEGGKIADGAMLPLAPGSVYYLKAATTHIVTVTSPLGLVDGGDGVPPLFFFRAGTNEQAIPSGSNCSIM